LREIIAVEAAVRSITGQSVSLGMLSTADLMEACSSFQVDAVTLPFIPDWQKAIHPVEWKHFQMVPLKENIFGTSLSLTRSRRLSNSLREATTKSFP
jgi:hypothetical protein